MLETVSITPASAVNAGTNAYTIREAAPLLRMSEKSVRRLIDRKLLRRCTKFGRVLIPKRDVDTFFEKHSTYAA